MKHGSAIISGTVIGKDIWYHRCTIPTYGAKENAGGLREKARANATPHMQAEANAGRDGAKANALVAWDGGKANAKEAWDGAKACVAMTTQ